MDQSETSGRSDRSRSPLGATGNSLTFARRALLGATASTIASTSLSAAVAADEDEEDEVDPDDLIGVDDEPVDREAMTKREINPPDGADLADYVEGSEPGELLVVSAGDYRWTREVAHDWNDWGIQGEPSGPQSVTIWVDDGWGFDEDEANTGILLDTTDATNVLVEHLHIDSDGRASPGFRFVPDEGGVLAHRIIDHSRGTTKESLWGTNTFLLHTGLESHVLIEGCCQHQRGNLSYDNSSQSFLWNAGEGRLTVKRCKASGMGDNIIYTRMPGPMLVENCVFANTTPSCVRLGGDNQTVRDCTFWIDTDDQELHNLDGTVNTRGIAPDPTRDTPDGGNIEHCSFVCKSTPFSSGVIASIVESPRLDIDACQFLLDHPDVDGVVLPEATVTINDTEFVTTTDSGATAGAGGVFVSENVGVHEALDPGNILPDYREVSFDWDRAHDFPDPKNWKAFVPVDEGPPRKRGH